MAVGLTVRIARANAPRPAAVAAEARQVAAIIDRATAEDRAARIAALAQRVRGLSPDDRLDPRLETELAAVVARMTPAERRDFVQRVLPMGIEPMIRAYAAMDDDTRDRVTDRLFRHFNESRWLGEGVDREAFGVMVESAVAQFQAADDPQQKLEDWSTLQRMLQVMQTR